MDIDKDVHDQQLGGPQSKWCCQEAFQGNRWSKTDYIVTQESLAYIFLEERKVKFMPSFKNYMHIYIYGLGSIVANLVMYEKSQWRNHL